MPGASTWGPTDYVFANEGRQPLSSMDFPMLLRCMGRTDITVHGFRSTFRDSDVPRFVDRG